MKHNNYLGKYTKLITGALSLRMKTSTMTRNSVLLALLTGVAATTQAANISWSAKHLTGAGQVSRNGKFLEGLNFNGGNNANSHNTTINGVTFKGFTNGKNNNNQFPNPSAKHFRSNSNGVVASGADWYTTGGGGLSVYDKLLSRSLWGSGAKVTLANLVAGERYEVQLFFGDTRSNNEVYIIIDQGTSRKFGNSVLTRFRSASNPSDNGLAITGTFTATGNTQSFTVKNPSDAANPFRLSAYQLRKLASAPGSGGITYHVAPNGKNTNPGTKAAPFRNIDRAAEVMKAGDTCLVHAGNYHEQVNKDGLKGTASKPITFKPYGNGPVIINGTASISGMQTNGWTRHKNGIFKTKLSRNIWQLFDDGEMIMAARWPNAQLNDGSVWDQDRTWAHAANNSTFGTWKVNTGGGKPNLAATNLKFEGAMAVLNIGLWQTHSRRVNSHNAGSNTFTYDTDNPIAGRADHWTTWKKTQQRAYLECHLNCLDTAREWYFNPNTKELYYWAPGGQKPAGDVRGKTIEHGFLIRNSSYVKVQGFKFFGCTFHIKDSNNCTIEDCNLEYFEYTRRMLGVEDPGLHYNSTVSTRVTGGSRNTVRNCKFAYCDGGALQVTGNNHLFENIDAHDLDWSGVGYRTFKFTDSRNTTVRRFSVRNAGASECIAAGFSGIVELCDMGSGLGVMQRPDGATIQVRPEQMDGTVVRYNWSHDNIKFGLRLDGDYWDKSRNLGVNATFHHNAIWGLKPPGTEPALKVKADYHLISNNLSYSNTEMDIEIQKDKPNENKNTRTFNNAAGELAGHRTNPNISPPGNVQKNFVGNVRNQVRNFSQRDFRPKKGSSLIDAGKWVSGISNGYKGAGPDIGPYEYGDNNYWIPGFQTTQASKPIPGNNATNQPGDTDLMWLGGWKGTSYDIYFGTNRNAVVNAGRNSPLYKGRQSNNIYRPNWVRNTACYWRIDTITPGRTVKGQVWKLTYGSVQGVNNSVANNSVNSNAVSNLSVTNSNNNSSGSVTQNGSGSSSSGSGGVGVSGSGAGVRVTEYHLSTGDFSGKTARLTLNRNLANDYYILVRGSRTGNNLSEPDSDYARVTAVPGGKGDLPSSGAANQIVLSRYVADFDWEGVVTVVECDNSASAAGFRLIDVAETALTGTSGTDTVEAWTNRSRVVLFGGYRGGGAALTQATSSKNQGSSVYTRLYPSGSGTLNWTRQAAGEKLLNAVMTTFVVEWGSEWNVQHVNVAGAKGGEGANATGEYTTRTINAVKRDHTWVWATGTRTDAGIGDCAEACLVTLGNGVNQNATESAVAVGSEYTDAYNFDVYVMTHSAIAVDHRFKADGHGSGLDVAVAVDQAPVGARFGWVYNGVNGTGDSHPRSRLWARYTANGTVTISRGFNGQNFPAWVQAINFSGLNQ